jgi:prepilin-type N-terminal cleavage/methylation domain-containing protein
MRAIGSRLRQQAGDTIVEVMVVLAVLGLAISISYTTANRSLLDARQAQENTQATELVQSQVETLRTLAAHKAFLVDGVTPDPDYIFRPAAQQPFCINSAGHVAVPTPSPPAPSDPCMYNNLYEVNITYQSTSVNPSILGGWFKVVATWADVQGEGNDTVTLSYRYYQQ